jgi:hypothetical protein
MCQCVIPTHITCQVFNPVHRQSSLGCQWLKLLAANSSYVLLVSSRVLGPLYAIFLWMWGPKITIFLSVVRGFQVHGKDFCDLADLRTNLGRILCINKDFEKFWELESPSSPLPLFPQVVCSSSSSTPGQPNATHSSRPLTIWAFLWFPREQWFESSMSTPSLSSDLIFVRLGTRPPLYYFPLVSACLLIDVGCDMWLLLGVALETRWILAVRSRLGTHRYL